MRVPSAAILQFDSSLRFRGRPSVAPGAIHPIMRNPASKTAKRVPQLVRTLLYNPTMEALCGAIVRDGDEVLIAVPENKTVDFYNYLRGFGYCFTVHCGGLCEDN